MAPTKKCPAPRRQRGPGENWKHDRSYPGPADLQARGERFAAAWRRAAECFTSCFFHALADAPHGPEVAAVLAEARRVDLRLGPEHFPSRQTWSLVAVICGFAETGTRLTPTAVLAAARAGEMALPIGGGGDELAELQTVLWRESSAALLLHHARELQRFARKARQVRRLWRVLSDTLENREADKRPVTILVRRSARRASA
jgi:hypothetical protein